MEEPVRKKSSSSDSELSDGWSLVDHSDTVPFAAKHVASSSSASFDLETGCLEASSSSTSTLPPVGFLTTCREVGHSEETSDAESVEIIQEDARLADFAYAPNLSRITKIYSDSQAKEVDKEEDNNSPHAKQSIFSDLPEFNITSNVFSNEWFKLLIFVSSLMALVLLLVSYTSLFFKDQSYSKSDGLIVLPDEDLSSLIADLTIFKEENKKLQEELNMIKYEYGNDKKSSNGNEDMIKLSSLDNSFIGLEVISDSSSQNSAEITYKALNSVVNGLGSPTVEATTQEPKTDDSNMRENQLGELMQIEASLKTVADNFGIKNIIISSYSIANNLENINLIVKNLNLEMDKWDSIKGENKRMQIQQKLKNLLTKIEQDFKKIVDKVAKRVTKIHDEFLAAFCRVKEGFSDVEDINCSGYKKDRKDNHKKNKKDQFKKLGKKKHDMGPSNFVSSFQVASFDADSDSSPDTSNELLTEEKSSQSIDDGTLPDLNNRFKRNDNINKDSSHKKFPQVDSSYEKALKKMYDAIASQKKLNRKNIYSMKHFNDKMKILESKEANGEIKSKHSEHMTNKNRPGKVKPLEDKTEVKKHKVNVENAHTAQFENKGNAKCTKKDCVKASVRTGQKVEQNIKVKNDDAPRSEFISGKNANPSVLNGSIHSKISNKHKGKVDSNGEWYLDLGEVRSLKRSHQRKSDWMFDRHRARMANRDSSNWMFDRALLREWCRDNSESSLCISSGQQMCEFCF